MESRLSVPGDDRRYPTEIHVLDVGALQQKLNPYEPSLHVTVDHAEDDAVNATLRQLWWPSCFIIAIAGLNAVLDVALLAEDLFWPYHSRLPQMGVPEHVIALTIHGLQCVGGFAMLRMLSYRLASASVVTCCIPCLSPFGVIGIPFGMWAARVLWLPETQRCFAVIRGRHHNGG